MEQPPSDLTACDVLIALALALTGCVRQFHLSTDPRVASYQCPWLQTLLLRLESILTLDDPPDYAGDQRRKRLYPDGRNPTWWAVYVEFVKHLGGDEKWHRWYQSARDDAERYEGAIEFQGLVAADSCADPRTGAYSHLRGLITDLISAEISHRACGVAVVDDE